MAESSQDAKKAKKEQKEKEARENPKKCRQYFAGISACLGGFHIGNIIGWASPASDMLSSFEEYSWIASIMTLGAAFSQIFTAILMELVGRKRTMVTLLTFTTLTWIAFAALKPNATYLIVLRFLHGFFAGGFCMVCPTFIGEIAHKSTRGCLGVCFQLFVTMGILYSYTFCTTKNFLLFSVMCGAPTLLGIFFLCVKETPVYLMKKGREEKAKASLEYYRGKSYDSSAEMEEIRLVTAKNDSSFCSSLKERACVKALLLLLGMHSIQQLSGINSIMFYAAEIFSTSASDGMECLLLIVLGIVQVVATLTAAFIVDRVGRRVLWFISLIAMFIALFSCGLYFQFDKSGSALPVGVCIYIYIIGFSLGAGPLPWAMLGELIPTRVKGPVATAVTFYNWVMAFGVTASYDDVVDGFGGASYLFYLYGAVTVLGLVFVVFCVVETNGKSLEEIQEELRTGKVRPTISGA